MIRVPAISFTFVSFFFLSKQFCFVLFCFVFYIQDLFTSLAFSLETWPWTLSDTDITGCYLLSLSVQGQVAEYLPFLLRLSHFFFLSKQFCFVLSCFYIQDLFTPLAFSLATWPWTLSDTGITGCYLLSHFYGFSFYM